MLKTGLTSITFRQLSAEDIIALAVEAGLDGIEWGGDVHVPPGDLEKACMVRRQTEAAGLDVCAYGSYFRCDNEAGPFTETLECAKALGAPVIRVWAGNKGSDSADVTYRAKVAASIRNAVAAARAEGITIALEYHGGTLTDTRESAHQLLHEVGLHELKLYWQPRNGGTLEGDLAELDAALPHLSHIHLFHWGKAGWTERLPLSEGIEPWREYIKHIRKAEGDRYITFEFVLNDDPAQLLKDAKVLHALLEEHPTTDTER